MHIFNQLIGLDSLQSPPPNENRGCIQNQQSRLSKQKNVRKHNKTPSAVSKLKCNLLKDPADGTDREPTDGTPLIMLLDPKLG